jgi:hypothetical protein
MYLWVIFRPAVRHLDAGFKHPPVIIMIMAKTSIYPESIDAVTALHAAMYFGDPGQEMQLRTKDVIVPLIIGNSFA